MERWCRVDNCWPERDPRVQPGSGNDVAGKRLPGSANGSERIVNDHAALGKVARFLERRRSCKDGRRRLGIVIVLHSQIEQRLVLAVVNFRNKYFSSKARAPGG